MNEIKFVTAWDTPVHDNMFYIVVYENNQAVMYAKNPQSNITSPPLELFHYIQTAKHCTTTWNAGLRISTYIK